MKYRNEKTPCYRAFFLSFLFPCGDNEDVSFGGTPNGWLLTHPVRPAHSSLASLKNMGSEPFFTLADPTRAHIHTVQNTQAMRCDVHSAGVSASVPSTPWSSPWHHSVLSIIKGGKQFRGNSGRHSLRSPWGKDRDGSLISSKLC